MSETGFFQQKRASPTGFALVVLMHAAVLGAVVMIKGPTFVLPDRTPIKTYPIPNRPPPDEIPPPPEPQPRQQQQQIDRPETQIFLPPINDDVPQRPIDPIPQHPRETIAAAPQPPAEPVRDPVRRDASVDPRYAHALQPPYPLAEQRAQRTGSVQVRVTIGTDGRVRAVERLSATSDAFWEVARRQALSHWRFRPATIDGRPVESSRVMTIQFRLADV